MRSPEQILADARTIAVVGVSPRPDRPSHAVMRYLLEQGYRCIPVRPLDCDDVLGVPCVASLADVDEPIDLVDVFRRSDAVARPLRPRRRADDRDRPRVGQDLLRRTIHAASRN